MDSIIMSCLSGPSHRGTHLPTGSRELLTGRKTPSEGNYFSREDEYTIREWAN
jgi:hypothetical protein